MIESINLNNWVTQEEACERLGVRRQTLYAYVSRGQIAVRSDPDHANRKLYGMVDIAALIDKRRFGRTRKTIAASTMAWGEPIVSTHLSTISRERLYYRGKDAIQLSEHATLEDVAGLLWNAGIPPDFSLPDTGGHVAGIRQANDSQDVPGLTRAYTRLGKAAAEGPLTQRLTVTELCAQAAALVGQLADGLVDLPLADALHAPDARQASTPLHLRIAGAWHAQEHAELLRKVLVLLADQELTSSAFAARVTASTGASLAACALTGLATLSGPLHGNAIVRVQTFLDDARRSGTEPAVRHRLANGTALPGFGHPLYPQGDPRAAALFAAFDVPAQIVEMVACVARLTSQRPTIDIALAALVEYARLPEGAPFALFAIARSVGWMAHSIEQFTHGTMLRPRAHYIGVAIETADPGQDRLPDRDENRE